MRLLRYVAIIMMSAVAAAPAAAAEHGPHMTLLVAEDGLASWDAMRNGAGDSAETVLLRDRNGRLNLAETNLNWAVALLESGKRPEVAGEVIEAVLSHQDTQDGSKTRGLFRWFADPVAPYSVDATLYLAPALAHLAAGDQAGAAGEMLDERAQMALGGLLAGSRPKDGFGAAMWAGAVASLANAVADPAGADAAASAVRSILKGLRREGFGGVHSPTYDALRIGGLRWALQFAVDAAAEAEARTALEICYADMLQRYEPVTGMIAGAIGNAYPSEYLGDVGVAQYLLACDIPSMLGHVRSAAPLAMYFALSDYAFSPALLAMAEVDRPEVEVRTRIPVAEGIEAAEAASTCTWVGDGMSLGTMSGYVDTSTIPIMATSDLPDRPTTYLYPFGGAATLQSAQSGGLALCSFNFDRVGVGPRIRTGVQGMLGRRDQIDRVLIGNHEWIGEPEAVGQHSVVALRRGKSYVGIKILAVDGEGTATSVKPGVLEWLREGNMDSLMFKVYARKVAYPLREPIFDVRLGVLVEIAPISQFSGLEEFAKHVSDRRISQRTSEQVIRMEDVDGARQIPGRHEMRSLAEMKFAKFIYHEMTLKDEALPLGLNEELLRNILISRTLPVELPESYLWASPALTLERGGDPVIGPQRAVEDVAQE